MLHHGSHHYYGKHGLHGLDYNVGNTTYAVCFLAGEFPAQLFAKWLGPDRWIPTQIVLFSIVSASQFALSTRGSFIACRALLAFLQGGFIPEVGPTPWLSELLILSRYLPRATLGCVILILLLPTS